MLFREIIAAYCDNHTKHINKLCVGKLQWYVQQQLCSKGLNMWEICKFCFGYKNISYGQKTRVASCFSPLLLIKIFTYDLFILALWDTVRCDDHFSFHKFTFPLILTHFSNHVTITFDKTNLSYQTDKIMCEFSHATKKKLHFNNF